MDDAEIRVLEQSNEVDIVKYTLHRHEDSRHQNRLWIPSKTRQICLTRTAQEHDCLRIILWLQPL